MTAGTVPSFDLAALIAGAKARVEAGAKVKSLRKPGREPRDEDAVTYRAAELEASWVRVATVYRETVFVCQCGSSPFGGPVALFTRFEHVRERTASRWLATRREGIDPRLQVEVSKAEQPLDWCTDCVPPDVKEILDGDEYAEAITGSMDRAELAHATTDLSAEAQAPVPPENDQLLELR